MFPVLPCCMQLGAHCRMEAVPIAGQSVGVQKDSLALVMAHIAKNPRTPRLYM